MSENRDEFLHRRQMRQKKIRARRLKIFLISFLIFAIAVFIILSVTVLFPVKNVTASGSNIYSKQDLINSLDISKKTNLLTVSEKDIENDLREELPFIDSVKIKRKLPDTLIITVSDAKEYECYNVEGKYYTVSEKGYVLACYDDYPEDTIEVKLKSAECVLGSRIIPEDKKAYDMAHDLINMLTSKDITVNYVDLSDKYNISAKVEDSFVVSFGNENYLDKKCAHLSGMIKSFEEGKTGNINLSMWTPDKTEGTVTPYKN